MHSRTHMVRADQLTHNILLSPTVLISAAAAEFLGSHTPF